MRVYCRMINGEVVWLNCFRKLGLFISLALETFYQKGWTRVVIIFIDLFW